MGQGSRETGVRRGGEVLREVEVEIIWVEVEGREGGWGTVDRGGQAGHVRRKFGVLVLRQPEVRQSAEQGRITGRSGSRH